uniref:DUF155 domain-containing protein n=1 Tax=uncultured Chloroflexota bacterium TaxID=166587 RepID=H5SBH6_9CHLR|nr:hypothetical protein HGMM_F07C06C34 [uncultured Chloroflexota bacterium]
MSAESVKARASHRRLHEEVRKARVCYLLVFPDPAPGHEESGETIRALKDAPYFQPVDIHLHTLGEERRTVAEVQVSILRQRYERRAQVVECHFELEMPLSAEGFRKRLEVENVLQRLILGEQTALFEEYSILLLDGIKNPDAFVEHYAPLLARFIRAQKEHLDERDIEDTLITRVRYSNSDLGVIDWEGAILIAPDGDFQSEIELLKVGNYQLLRYRMLDQSVEGALRQLNQEFARQKMSLWRLGSIRSTIQRILRYRLELMIEFERTEQNLLLIGDWYTSKLYRAIREELYLDEWKEAVRSKLDDLEHILGVIRDNFSLSWQDLLETIQISGWLLLLIGYFLLFFLESGLWKR